MKYIDSEKLITILEERKAQRDQWYERYGDTVDGAKANELSEVIDIISSLQQEQPDNEDIDKVAQELYEHLYELKRRNNVPTNLYDKQEIIDLWKAGIEYGRNHPKQEQPNNMIQWTGQNLQEVVSFTGKSPKFGEWFKSWEDLENYVHSHGDILKLFCEDGSHYEVPVGAWIVKTPDGYNMPSVSKYIQQKQSDFDDIDPKHLVHSHYTKLREIKTGRVFWAEYSSEAAEWYEAGTGKAYSISDVEIVKEQSEVDLEKLLILELPDMTIDEDLGLCTCNHFGNQSMTVGDIKEIARHFYELGLNARKEGQK